MNNSKTLDVKLRATKRELENIRYALDQSSIVAITDKNGVIEYVNDRFVEISKYSRDELIGKTHRIISSKYHSKEYIENLWKTIQSGRVWRGELRNQAKDGSYYWVDTTITPLLDKSGKPERFIAIRNDITKRKNLEQQKDEFMAIASHELKTPVTSIKAYIQLLKNMEIKKQNQQEVSVLEKVDEQVDKLSTLINELLDVTKIETGKIEFEMIEFDLKTLIENVIEEMRMSTTSHEIVAFLQDSPLVYGDRNRVGQVLANFLNNAVKYSPEADRVIVTLKTSNKQARVCVKDFGIGIPKIEQDKIFKKFYRSNNHNGQTISGLGLGLYIAFEIIARHQGRVFLESEEKLGSEFCFALPITGQKT